MRYREFKYIVKEAEVFQTSNDRSMQKYIGIINQMISRGQPILIGKDGTDGSITPMKNHPLIKSENDIIKGTEDGEPAEYPAGKVYKSAEFGGPNRGNVAEGLFGIAIYDTLKNGSTSKKSIMDIATKGPIINGAESKAVGIKGHNPKDILSLTIRLGNNNFEGMRDIKFLNDKKMQGYMTQMEIFCNNRIENIKEQLQKNDKIDKIRVVADGVSDEATSKVDVIMDIVTDGKKQNIKYEYSVKTGNIKQFGQFSNLGGNVSKKYSAEERYNAQTNFWKEFGVTLEDDGTVEDMFVGSAMQNFREYGRVVPVKDVKTKNGDTKTITDPKGNNPFDYTYQEATKQLTTNFKSFEEESITNMLTALQKFATGNNLNAKMANFSEKDFEELDFKKLTPELLRQYKFTALGPKDIKSSTPEVQIFANKEPFLTLRLYVSDKKLTNLVEKEKGLTKLVQVLGK
jgi:hypothetical protein